MKLEIRTDQHADIRPGDVFEVSAVKDDYVMLQRVYRPAATVANPPQTLGVSVAETVKMDDKVR